MDYVVVDRNKRHKRHIPEEVLSSHNFVKCDKSPGLNCYSKKDIIKHGKASKKDNRPLGHKHEDRHYFAAV